MEGLKGDGSLSPGGKPSLHRKKTCRTETDQLPLLSLWPLVLQCSSHFCHQGYRDKAWAQPYLLPTVFPHSSADFPNRVAMTCRKSNLWPVHATKTGHTMLHFSQCSEYPASEISKWMLEAHLCVWMAGGDTGRPGCSSLTTLCWACSHSRELNLPLLPSLSSETGRESASIHTPREMDEGRRWLD